MITRRHLMERYGTTMAIGRILNIGDNAIRHWPMDDPIPDQHQLALCYCIDPEYFKETAAQYAAYYPRFRGDTDPRLRSGRRVLTGVV